MPSEIVFRDVRVFDGLRVRSEDHVRVVDGVIESLGDSAGHQVADATDRVEIDGRSRMTLLPGLIDAHYHLLGDEPLVQATTFGTTTVLSMGDDPNVVRTYRESARAGGAHADIRSAGVSAKAPGGRAMARGGTAMPTVSSPADADAFVSARIAEGSDYLKVRYEDGDLLGELAGGRLPVVSSDTLTALTAAAHRRGLKVLVHIGTLQAAHDAVDAGVDGLAHTFFDRAPDAVIADRLAAGGVFVIPTLNIFDLISGRSSWRETVADDALVAPYLRTEDLAVSAYRGTHVHDSIDLSAAAASVREFRRAGVRLLAGSDPTTFLHGVGLWRELEMLVEAGMGVPEALASATSVPAEIFGLTDRGRIAPGLRADLILVDGDVTDDVTELRKIVGVWRGGVRIDRIRPARMSQSNRPEPTPTESNTTGAAPGSSGFLCQSTQGDRGDFGLVTLRDNRPVVYRRDNDTFGYPWKTLAELSIRLGWRLRSAGSIAARDDRWSIALAVAPDTAGPGDRARVVIVDGDGENWDDPRPVGMVDVGCAPTLTSHGDAILACVPSGGALVLHHPGVSGGAPHREVIPLPEGVSPWGAPSPVVSDGTRMILTRVVRKGDSYPIALVLLERIGETWVDTLTQRAAAAIVPVSRAAVDGDPALVVDAMGRCNILAIEGERVVHLRRGLDHAWTRVGELPAPKRTADTAEVRLDAVSAISGSFGNIEAVARSVDRGGNAIYDPYYHDAGTDAWASLPTITNGQRVFGELGLWEPVMRAKERAWRG